MGMRYIISSIVPSLLIFLVTAVMVFALTFIYSVSMRIDRMIAVLGSGSIYSQYSPDPELLPQGTEINEVTEAEGILYSREGEAVVHIKGVDDDYFSGMRKKELSIEYSDGESLNPAVISSSLAERLGLSLSDRMTLLLYDSVQARVRPLLCTVHGIFQSVYPQLDEHLLYISSDSAGGVSGIEILLPEGRDADRYASVIPRSASYRTMYSSLYENVRSSISILYFIFIIVALLAAFFASDIAESYISRDRKDIEQLMVLGVSRRKIRAIYFHITLFSASVAVAAGCLAGLLLSLLSPSMMEKVAEKDSSLLLYYVTSFSIEIPYMRTALMLVLMILTSSVAVYLSLSRIKLADMPRL